MTQEYAARHRVLWYSPAHVLPQPWTEVLVSDREHRVSTMLYDGAESRSIMLWAYMPYFSAHKHEPVTCPHVADSEVTWYSPDNALPTSDTQVLAHFISGNTVSLQYYYWHNAFRYPEGHKGRAVMWAYLPKTREE